MALRERFYQFSLTKLNITPLFPRYIPEPHDFSKKKRIKTQLHLAIDSIHLGNLFWLGF